MLSTYDAETLRQNAMTSVATLRALNAALQSGGLEEKANGRVAVALEMLAH